MVDLWTTPNVDACPPASTGDICLTCGACCASFRVSFYWSESDEAVASGVPPDMTCHVAPLLCAMKGTDRPDPWCIALQGSVGGSVWCSIYDRRPSVCHEVVPSATAHDRSGACHLWVWLKLVGRKGSLKWKDDYGGVRCIGESLWQV